MPFCVSVSVFATLRLCVHVEGFLLGVVTILCGEFLACSTCLSPILMDSGFYYFSYF